MVGADTLLIECAQRWLERGHELAAIVAGSPRVAHWAATQGIPTLDAHGPAPEWAAELRRLEVQHLFAITHLHLLPAEVLAAPTGLAINFHDGPLPEYAGLNTPVWGLLHDRAQWGVTWHLLADGVDTGDVVVRRSFPLSPRETSLSLNTGNVEHALDTFGELIELLEAGALTPQAQDVAAVRHEYRRADRPDGVLDWQQPADAVDRVVRALHFGPHPNPVAAAVLWHPAASFVVGNSEVVVDVVSAAADVAPGTVLAADTAGLTVACASGAVRLTQLTTLEGAEVSPGALLASVGGAVGAVLPQLTAAQRATAAQAAVAAQRHEAELTRQLTALSPAEFPWPSTTARGARGHMTIDGSTATTVDQMVAALAVVLSRLTSGQHLHVALALPHPPPVAPLHCAVWPLDLALGTQHATVGDAAAAAQHALQVAISRPAWQRDLVARTPGLAGAAHLAGGLQLPVGLRTDALHPDLPQSIVVVEPAVDGWQVAFDTAAVDPSDARQFAGCLALAARAVAHQPSVPVAAVELIDEPTRHQVLHQWNATGQPVPAGTIHQLVLQQAARTPSAPAVTCGQHSLTYAELVHRSAALAAQLRAQGVGPDSLVGVHVERGAHLLVAVLGVLRAGGAYVPLDPAYPADRLRHMIADSGAKVVVCQAHHQGRLPLPDGQQPALLLVDEAPLAPTDSLDVADTAEPHHLAYCIYTSGSTGTPKGVLVEHRNVVNFFTAMDPLVPRSGDDTWFAVTSLSFDISVLELLYTLARGMHVVVHAPATRASVAAPRAPGVPGAAPTSRSRKGMDFSLFYFSGDEAEDAHAGKYRLLLEGARFADANGFCAVWTPERHFHAFGGLYPNPAITAAAVAAVTERVAVRAGSVVLPLHHPAEIAEAWSVVDNLSNGRAGVAFASGWQPNDFVFRPQNYANAKQVMFESIEQVRRLWRGETLEFPGPEGMSIPLATLPRPVQAELPVWVTTAGNPATFEQAGAAGANLLTHLLGQSVDQLAPKLAAYRAARAAAGHDPDTGVVTLMLHTFVGTDDATVRATVREPLRNYLKTSFNLVREYAWSFPTFQRPDGKPVEHVSDLADDDVANLSPEELDAVLEYAFQRYYDTSGLFGTPEKLAPFVDSLKAIGVDEVACLLDFGVANDAVLAGLPHIATVLRQSNPATQDGPVTAGSHDNSDAEVDERSLGEQLLAARPTHLQCTPSMARLIADEPAGRTALGQLPHLYVGGEALPPPLAAELRTASAGTVTNMYGPTETTIWSSAWALQPQPSSWVPIGRPIANNQCYVLDAQHQPVPPGVAGHLWIGGDGVVRGYHQRPELTAERFVADPFRGAPHRMYFTGDLARWRQLADGQIVLEFLGRSDHQVKLRGYRIELGEVEARLAGTAGVADTVAVVREDTPGDQQLVAYVVGAPGAHLDPHGIRDALRDQLPEVMVPSHVVELRSLPRTPNGKLDRAALPPPRAATRTQVAAPPASELEAAVLAAWQRVLAADAIGIDDNFFDIGGHSLLVVRLHRALQEQLGRQLALTDLYRFPTVRTFAASLATAADDEPQALSAAIDRGARRRANLRGRT